MRFIRLAALLAVTATIGRAQTAPLMKVLIAPGAMDEAVNDGDVRITITVPGIDAAAGAPLFSVPASADLTVTDASGPVDGAADPGGQRKWKASRAVKGDLVIKYRVHVHNTPTNGGIPPLGPRIDGHGFSAAGLTFLAIPEGTTPYRILIDWDLSAMGAGATAVSSFGDGTVEVPAGPPVRLRLAAFMAGPISREPAAPQRTGFAVVWTGDPGFDLRPPMQWTSKLHAWMNSFFQTANDRPYHVFLRFNPANAGGGVAFPNSFVVTYGAGVTGESMKHILPHEMTHTWTANDLGKWYDEGSAVYYQALLPWRAGLITTEQYLDDINKTASRYYTNAEIDAPEAKIIPNFFSNMWLNTLAYDRGALYFAALNGKLRRASGGKRSIDDLIRAMVHKARAGEAIAEDTWVTLLQKEIGDDAVALHRSMMQGGIVRPESDDYGPCFQREIKKVRRYELGFNPKSMPDGKKQVEGLVEGSEAAKAGLKNGDIVTYPVITTEGVRRDPDATITMQVFRESGSTTITFLPRGVALDIPQWKRMPGISDAACKN